MSGDILETVDKLYEDLINMGLEPYRYIAAYELAHLIFNPKPFTLPGAWDYELRTNKNYWVGKVPRVIRRKKRNAKDTSTVLNTDRFSWFVPGYTVSVRE